MIRVIYGDEPYFVTEYKKKLTEHIQNQQMDVSRQEGAFDESVFAICQCAPFMSDRRVVFLECQTLKDLDEEVFFEYLEKPVATTDLCITVREVDKRLKVLKELDEKGVLKAYNKLTDKDQLVREILLILDKEGARITTPAMNEFLSRVNYFDIEEMNLVMIAGYARTLASMSKEIGDVLVKEVVPVFELPNIFEFARLIKDNRIEELLHQLNLLDEKEAIKVMSLLLKELRVGWKLKDFTSAQIVSQSVFSGCDKQKLLEAMEIVTDTINGIKTGRFSDALGLRFAFAAVSDVLAA